MPLFISLLRGINVSGQKIIPMVRLKDLYESVGFRNVRTYVQSGNVVFESSMRKPEAIRETIEAAIGKTFGINVPVIIRTPAELHAIVDHFPFATKKGFDESKALVVLCDAEPAPALVKAMAPFAAKSSDTYKIVGREVYLHCPNGYGRTLLTNTFFERHLKVSATTRNWRTVGVLVKMAEEQ